jgi:glutamine amidotransferase
MQALNHSNLANVIKEVAKSKPLLGICLGMQALLTDSAENGSTLGLDILPGHVVHFSESLQDAQGNNLKIPHMGWNQVHFSSHPLWDKIQQNSRFYFVHSYYAVPNDATLITATTEYPCAFACALARENLFAVQFHPEKSQAVGLQLLNNFLHWDGQV